MTSRVIAPSRLQRYAEEAGEAFGITAAHVLHSDRRGAPVKARWAVWARLHQDGFSSVAIGRATGHHHATVLHGLKQVQP